MTRVTLRVAQPGCFGGPHGLPAGHGNLGPMARHGSNSRGGGRCRTWVAPLYCRP